MTYALEQLAADCRGSLRRDPGQAGREEVRKFIERACADPEFVRTHLGPTVEDARKILYEDPELGFCILAHVHLGVANSQPHDHGPSWAVYGQVAGETEMVEWKEVSPGHVEKVRQYRLCPGQAVVYHEGDIHSPRREGATRLLRVEGVNMDHVGRRRFSPVDPREQLAHSPA